MLHRNIFQYMHTPEITMITKTITALTQPTKGMLEPVQKLNQNAVAAFEKLAAHQLDSLKAHSDLAVGKIKAVAEVRDFDDFRHLMSDQTDFLREASDRMMSDLKEVVRIGADFVSLSNKAGAKPPKAA